MDNITATTYQQSKIKEKLALAKKLGMKRWVDTNSLMDAKFSLITEAQIEEKIGTSWYREFKLTDLCRGLTCVGVFGTITLCPLVYERLMMFGLWVGIMACSIFATSYFHKTYISTCELEDWEDNLPYGALLSVDEAAKKGYNAFVIHYPSKDRHTRIKADPIITAKRTIDSIMTTRRYEIFAWDDGKLYE